MDSSTFNSLVDSAKRAGFPDRQMDIITVAIGRVGVISTAQVAQLLKLISSPDARLELAKMAYGYTHDRDSYESVIGNALCFDNAKAILQQYLRLHW